jgi:hypothetical protein
MAKQPSQTPRASGSIRLRGSSFQIRVYAGINPETGEAHYLTATRPTMKSAKTERDRLVGLVAAGRAPLTNGLFENAIRQWLDYARGRAGPTQKRPGVHTRAFCVGAVFGAVGGLRAF